MRKTIFAVSILVVLAVLTGCQSFGGEKSVVSTVSVSASATVTLIPDSA